MDVRPRARACACECSCPLRALALHASAVEWRRQMRSENAKRIRLDPDRMTTANALHWDSHDIRPRSRKMCIATTCPMYWAVALPRTNQLQGGAPEGASAAPPQSCGCSCERDCNATAVRMQTHVNASVLLLTHQESLQIWARARRLQLGLRSAARKNEIAVAVAWRCPTQK